LRHTLEELASRSRIAKPLQVIDELEETFKVNDLIVAVARKYHPRILFRTP
jgi:hypothetical protein